MDRRSFIDAVRSVLFREDHVCPWWLAYSFDNPLRRILHDPDALLGPYVKPGMTVADIGCGLGYFSLALARLVGHEGMVVAIDLQQEMLDRMRKRADRKGLGGIIRSVLAAPDDIMIKEPVDFVLCFWMVHEVPDIPRFLKQVSSVLKPGGKVLIAEPRLHVRESRFREELQSARGAGFSIMGSPSVGMSRSAVLVKKT
jgi:2-polyprenyl-3-methyl-5-hydroxy-6-metoxy-1,4-benzoquinol methylase